MRIGRGAAALAVIGLAGLALAGLALGRGEAAGGDTPASGLPQPNVAALGKVEPLSEEVRVAAGITGRLAEVRVDEGQTVAAGQVVAVVENAEHLARLHQAEANLRLKRAALTRLLDGPREAERREARAAVAEAQSVLPQTAAELERQAALVADGHASRQALERAQRDHQVARARLAEATHHRDGVDADARDDDIVAARADIDLAAARVEEAQASYQRTLVRSPVGGLVLRRVRRAGEMVSEAMDSPIVAVGDISVLRVRAEVDEADIGLLAVGQPAWVQAPAWGERRFAGHVSRIGSEVGRKAITSDRPAERVDTRVLEVLIDLDPGSPLPVGLRVDAFIVPARPGAV